MTKDYSEGTATLQRDVSKLEQACATRNIAEGLRLAWNINKSAVIVWKWLIFEGMKSKLDLNALVKKAKSVD